MSPINTQVFDEVASIIPARPQVEDREVSAAEVIAVLLKHKRFISVVTAVVTVVTAIGVSFLPNSFKADALIVPPQQQQSSIAALAGSALGGLAMSGMASQLGLKNPSDLYIGILGSRTIADEIVKQFHLEQVYDKKLASDARKALIKHASFTSGKDSLIKITVEDRDPKRAADLANAFIDELYKQNSRLALTDAAQRRMFFEQQLKNEKDALADAEVALKSTQQSTGLLAPTGQAEVLIRSGAQLRAEIASKEVQLQSMRSYATDQNPQIDVLKREIAALQGQLGRLEVNQGSNSAFQISAGKLPQAGLEYIRKLRDLKYHETLFELLAKQYEIARMDEAKQAPVIQVVDRAVAPDKKSWPPRAIYVLGSALLAVALTSASVFVTHRFRSLLSGVNTAS
jgi:tyrosine-protein kinase Etk/Wzc